MFTSNLNKTTTSTINETHGMWGYISNQEGWVDVDEAEFLAGGANGVELQMDPETLALYNTGGEKAVQIRTKIINKKKVAGTKTIHVLFSFELEDEKFTAFLNTFTDGRRYIGIAKEKPYEVEGSPAKKF